jgi:hypothetical protein
MHLVLPQYPLKFLPSPKELEDVLPISISICEILKTLMPISGITKEKKYSTAGSVFETTISPQVLQILETIYAMITVLQKILHQRLTSETFKSLSTMLKLPALLIPRNGDTLMVTLQTTNL